MYLRYGQSVPESPGLMIRTLLNQESQDPTSPLAGRCKYTRVSALTERQQTHQKQRTLRWFSWIGSEMTLLWHYGNKVEYFILFCCSFKHFVKLTSICCCPVQLDRGTLRFPVSCLWSITSKVNVWAWPLQPDSFIQLVSTQLPTLHALAPSVPALYLHRGPVAVCTPLQKWHTSFSSIPE